jgi:predicted DNA-binding transcriptional regulator YafY
MRLTERTTVTVVEAARALGISREVAYRDAAELGAIRIGRRLVVPLAPLAGRLGLDEGELLRRIDATAGNGTHDE